MDPKKVPDSDAAKLDIYRDSYQPKEVWDGTRPPIKGPFCTDCKTCRFRPHCETIGWRAAVRDWVQNYKKRK